MYFTVTVGTVDLNIGTASIQDHSEGVRERCEAYEISAQLNFTLIEIK